ncbi:MAG: hypothetical protein V1875_05730 [Candidatus Altiarchaeota archaeon]
MSTDDAGKKKKIQDQSAPPEDQAKTIGKRENIDRLRIEADYRTKDKLLRRPLIEEYKPTAKGAEPTPEDKAPVGVDMKPERPKGEEMAGGKALDHHAKGDLMHVEEAAKGDMSLDVTKGVDVEAAKGVDDHDGGQDSDAGSADGGDEASGMRIPGRRQIRPQASSVEGYVKEAVLRHWDSVLKDEAKGQDMTSENFSQRRWIFGGMSEIINERMLNDLRGIEDRTPIRHRTIRDLNILKAQNQLDSDEAAQLRRMEDEEALRYWLREKFIRRAPLEKQKKIHWLKPLGKGAMGVTPYTVLNSWDLLTPSQKTASRWLADNYFLRWQNAIVPRFLPKKPSMAWFRQKKKGEIEHLFDDWNEEIYSDKAWKEKVKKGEAELEKLEEELTGYDQFTVAEEGKIAKMLDDYLKAETAIGKEDQYY